MMRRALAAKCPGRGARGWLAGGTAVGPDGRPASAPAAAAEFPARDSTKRLIGTSVFADLVPTRLTDAGAAAVAASYYYAVRGLSACTQAPGP